MLYLFFVLSFIVTPYHTVGGVPLLQQLPTPTGTRAEQSKFPPTMSLLTVQSKMSDPSLMTITKLQDHSNFPTWHQEIQHLLSAHNLWTITTGVDIKPMKPNPPTGANPTIDQRLAHERASENTYQKLRNWERKSREAYVWIKATCEDGVAELFEGYQDGQVAYMILCELLEPMGRQVLFAGGGRVSGREEMQERMGACWQREVVPLYCLSRLSVEQEGGGRRTMEWLGQEVKVLVERCRENGYEVPEWMVCLFFRRGLRLGEREEMAVRTVEMDAWCMELGVDGIIRALKDLNREDGAQ